MSKMLVGSIDLSKLDKSKIVTTDKNGIPFSSGAKYLNVIVWMNDEVDQYGNIASIQENISKEDKEKGGKATYIGNLKYVVLQSQDPIPANAQKPSDESMGEDDLPF